MLITATTKPLRVDYKKTGKVYNVPEDAKIDSGTNTDEKSTFPFDSQHLDIGEAFNMDDVEVVRVVEIVPGVQQQEDLAHR